MSDSIGSLREVFEQAQEQAAKNTFVPRGIDSLNFRLQAGPGGRRGKAAPKKAAKKAAKKAVKKAVKKAAKKAAKRK